MTKLIRNWVVLATLVFASAVAQAATNASLAGGQHILFLGDSITHSGQYADYFEVGVRLRGVPGPIDYLNLGLPSETVSGLSEAGHAGGRFPRPDLHERLQRTLEKTKPDLVFVCYGMNDGIYYP